MTTFRSLRAHSCLVHGGLFILLLRSSQDCDSHAKSYDFQHQRSSDSSTAASSTRRSRNMLTSCESEDKANSVPAAGAGAGVGLGFGSRTIDIDKAFERFTPVPSVLLDSSFRIIQVSASYLALNHLISDECHGLNIYDLVKEKALIPGVAALQIVLANAIASKNVYSTRELQAVGRAYSSLRAVPIFDQDTLLYVLLEVQDTTAEHQRPEAINEQLDTNDTYRVLVETVKDYAIFMLDTKGNVRTWNAGAALLKGYKPEEVIGQHFSIFYGADDIIAEKPKKELEICLRDGKVEDESWRYRRDGSRF